MSQGERIYTLSLSGNEDRARELLGLGRKVLRMAAFDMQRNGVDQWKHRLASEDGNILIDVLAKADGNDRISITYRAPEPAPPEPPKTRSLLLHCRIELTLCKEIPNYEKDPAYIAVEPIPVPEEGEAESYKVKLHVLYDVGGQMEIILKEEGDYLVPGELTMEEAIPEIEKYTGYTHLEKIVEPAYPFSEGTFVDPEGDYNRAGLPTDEWIDSRPWFEDYATIYKPASVLLPLSDRRHKGPINILKYSYSINDEDITESVCDLYELNQHWDDYESSGIGKTSEATGFRVGIRSEVVNQISRPGAFTLTDVRHIESLGAIGTEQKSDWLIAVKYNPDGTTTQIVYYVNIANVKTSFPFYVETQSSVEIKQEIGDDFTGQDGTLYRHKEIVNYADGGEYANLFDLLFHEDVSGMGMNWLVFPALNYSLPKDLADVGSDAADISASPLSEPRVSTGISAPGRMVLELRSFFANTDNATTLKMTRKSYLAQWQSDSQVDTYWNEGEEERYWKYGYNPFDYTRSDDEPEDVDIETAQNHNPANCPNFITEKGDLVDVALFSAIYAIGNFAKVTRESVNLSERYEGEIDLSYVSDWTKEYHAPAEMIQTVKGKRPWPKYLDCEKWEYVNAYGAGVSIRNEFDLAAELEWQRWIKSIGLPHNKELIREANFLVSDTIRANKNIYDAGDGSEEPATAESVIVNAIYRHLEEHGYDRYAPVCDIRLEAELYDIEK